MSVDTCVVTPSIRLEGTNARATQVSRCLTDTSAAGSAAAEAARSASATGSRRAARAASRPQIPTRSRNPPYAMDHHRVCAASPTVGSITNG